MCLITAYGRRNVSSTVSGVRGSDALGRGAAAQSGHHALLCLTRYDQGCMTTEVRMPVEVLHIHRVVAQVCCPAAHSGMPAASISSRNSCARLGDSRPWRKDRISVGRTLTKSATTLKLYPCRVKVDSNPLMS
jgi:hypothetical protein